MIDSRGLDDNQIEAVNVMIDEMVAVKESGAVGVLSFDIHVSQGGSGDVYSSFKRKIRSSRKRRVRSSL